MRSISSWRRCSSASISPWVLVAGIWKRAPKMGDRALWATFMPSLYPASAVPLLRRWPASFRDQLDRWASLRDVPDAPVQRRPGLVDDVRSDDIRGTDWPVAPRVAEDVYSVADAVVVGSLLITLLKHADRVSSACLSMLVNAMAPIRAEAGADVWRQTTFYPFALTSRWARGTVLDVRVQCETHETKDHGRVPVIDVVATHDQDAQAAAVFLVNRSPVDAQTVEVDLRAFGPIELVGTRSLFDADPYATNSAGDPLRVVPRANDTARLSDGVLLVELPAVSWTVVTLRSSPPKSTCRSRSFGSKF